MSKSEILDQQPPAAIDSERAVLGSILLSRNGAAEVFPMLRPDDFYDEPNRALFTQFCDMHYRGVGIDLVTLTHRLRL